MAVPLEQFLRHPVLFREVNERVAEVLAAWDDDPNAEFLCECSNEDCMQTLPLSVAEYKRVRSSPNLFVIVPGHELPEVDRLVEVGERFSFVEKTTHTSLVFAYRRDATPSSEGASSKCK